MSRYISKKIRKQVAKISKHLILPKTVIAKGTIKILGLNDDERLTERLALLEAGYFPHPNSKVITEL